MQIRHRLIGATTAESCVIMQDFVENYIVEYTHFHPIVEIDDHSVHHGPRHLHRRCVISAIKIL